MCPVLTETINDQLNIELATLPLKTDIDNNAFIDYSLVDSPFVMSNAVFVDGKGTFFYFPLETLNIKYLRIGYICMVTSRLTKLFYRTYPTQRHFSLNWVNS